MTVPTHSTYRPDIDGLRAVAVLGVLVFHAFPGALPGGFAGVDIFFVISGYLISGIILQGLERGQFSFADFYARRIRRIFPALALVLSTFLLVGWFVLLPDEYAMLGKHALGGAAFVANFVFRSEDSYFNVASEAKPFLHLWSLGIEEQFYIVWPILLTLAYRFRFKLGIPILVVLVLSFGLNVANARSNPATTFFLPHTRFWELLIGCALAYVHMRLGRNGSHRWLKLTNAEAGSVAFTGAVLIGIAYCLLDRNAVFPGWWALAPTLGAAFIIHAGTSASFNRYVLASRPLVFIGLISYPLYLWHWPLLSFAHILQIDEPAIVRASLLGLSFVLAWATYRWIETPIRKKRLDVRINTTRRLAGILAAMAVVSLFIYRQALEPRLQEELWPIAEARGDWEYSSKKAIRDSELGLPLRVLTGSTQDAVLFIGDSHIQQFYPRLESLLSDPAGKKSVIFVTRGGCNAIPDVRRADSRCDGFMEKAYQMALRSYVDTVVIGCSWTGLFDSQKRYKDLSIYITPESIFLDQLFDDYAKILKGLKDAGKQVVIVLPTPMGLEFDPSTMLTAEARLTGRAAINDGIDRARLEEGFAFVVSKLTRVARLSGAEVINPIEYLCGATRCPSVLAGKPVAKDGSHYRPFFVREHVRFFDHFVVSDSSVLSASAR